ncbi:MAG TPA: bifunctional DNA-formamidopyrimidine glycosylase/DNA-(apurinic or apyrimidinic site) lyase [Thermomicrobiales bacterium]|nr:bifunctional DNA-formamidopyrimidine glycosylase/DNA-(apurinic or apyrimidinic site) lyase [Thermomicrobiales bacterium]
MPELPEVETVRRSVEDHLAGLTVASIDVRLPKILRDSPLPDAGVFEGATVVGARRRAKVLAIDFSNDLSLMIHLKLAGQWAILFPDGSRLVAGHPIPKPDGPYPHKSTHADIRFTDGTLVHYSDIRQFGWWRIVPSEDVEDVFSSFGFGPEGIGAPLDVADLSARMGTRGIPIKTLLLNQSFIAGLGNIYVDEVLFRARVNPATPAKDVSPRKRKAILEAVPWVLEQGLKQGGAKIVHNIAHPVDNFPAVHGREGEPCFTCGTPIRKTRVGQRGTYYCPKCQRPVRKPANDTKPSSL